MGFLCKPEIRLCTKGVPVIESSLYSVIKTLLCMRNYNLTGILQGDTVKGRCLVIADGATSRLATELGYCTEPPKGICSRAFVEGGTHNTKFDGRVLLAFLNNSMIASKPFSAYLPNLLCTGPSQRHKDFGKICVMCAAFPKIPFKLMLIMRIPGKPCRSDRNARVWLWTVARDVCLCLVLCRYLYLD